MGKKLKKPSVQLVNPELKGRVANDAKRTIRQLSKVSPTSEDLGFALNQIKTLVEEQQDTVSPAHDRSSAIFVSAIIEYFLEEILILNMNKIDREIRKRLFDENGPVSTFSAKILLAYALGIINAGTRNDLDVIRKIRNAFAHARISATFKSHEISSECKKLRPFSYLPSIDEAERSSATPRKIFLLTCLGIISRMQVHRASKALEILKKQRKQLRILLKSAQGKGFKNSVLATKATLSFVNKTIKSLNEVALVQLKGVLGPDPFNK